MTRFTGLLLLTITLAGCARLPVRATAVDLAGREWAPLESPTEVRVIIFTSVDCPIASAYTPELRRIVSTYEPRGVRFFLVHADPAVTRAEARRHRREFLLPGTVLVDRGQQLVRALGARVTPEAFVIEPDATRAAGYRVRYRGRIDDWYVDLGKKRFQPSRHDLCDALDAVLTGGEVREPRTTAIGCTIPEG